MAAARAGLGATQVPDYMAAEALAAGELVELLADQRPPADPIHAVHLSQRHVPTRTRAFLDFLAGLDPARAGG